MIEVLLLWLGIFVLFVREGLLSGGSSNVS